MADELTLALRGLALGLALALLLAATGLHRQGRRALWPVLAGLMAYLLRGAPQLAGAPLAVLLPLAVGALLVPATFWWLVHSAFDDRADVPPAAWGTAAVLVIAGLLDGPVAAGWPADLPHLVQKLCAIGFVVAGLRRLWLSGAGDLVAGRRRLRGWLLAYIGGHGLAVLAAELLLRGQRAPQWLDALNVGAIAAALAVALALLLRFREDSVDTLFGPEPAAAPPAVAVAAKRALPEGTETPWLRRLGTLMDEEKVYRDPELTVAALATRLGLPEYRLRELIHDRLGHRNFQAFVNAHRLREAERRLADPACDGRPILTLALEAGFGSIGPFNRAFRERHGTSPSEYRGRRGAPPAAAELP
jgi:AraC-like DNA-binding protein